ncbi:MAG: aspartate ammonia-lyase [Calditrichaeota bacterium]|nr:aspartate ammonia-lyase [Calditrichota bacterium]
MSKSFREEQDFLGCRQIPWDALYGIHTARAAENFPLSGRKVHSSLIRAYGAVKWACARTNFELGYLKEEIYRALAAACREMTEGKLDEHILIDALQGGAGTSTNMNVNEVLCNRALQILGKKPGSYRYIHPVEHVNMHQSTNDTFPTALRVAAIGMLRSLEEQLIALSETLQESEQKFAHIVRIARTELQDAVLTTMGRTFGAFAEAVSRDRWRIYKSEERLRVVNLGGTAIGTGITAPRRYIFRVVENLKEITGFGLARAENLAEATQNADVFVEVSGILQACATNLFKISNDLRWLSSGPHSGLNELQLPARQAGSSIMPGKVNPVIPEAVMQVSLTVMSDHERLSKAAALGNMELNAFMPLIADALLQNLQLLKNAAYILNHHCLQGIKVNEKVCQRNVQNSTATLTALVGKLGYQKAQKLAGQMQKTDKSVRQLILEQKLMDAETFDYLISAEAVNRLGNPEEA